MFALHSLPQAQHRQSYNVHYVQGFHQIAAPQWHSHPLRPVGISIYAYISLVLFGISINVKANRRPFSAVQERKESHRGEWLFYALAFSPMPPQTPTTTPNPSGGVAWLFSFMPFSLFFYGTGINGKSQATPFLSNREGIA